MSKFSETPGGIYVVPDTSAFLKDRIDPGYYSISYDDQRKCFFLVVAQPFEINHKVYGNSLQHADRILNTFERRADRNTTAAFEGLKGSGKTLLAKRICMSFVEKGGIVITCNTAYCGDSFNKFLQDINQSKIVFFDEFEKTYSDKDARNGILTLFDGTWQSHTLYLLTTNTDMYSNTNLEYFSNRPGRVYFNIQFKAVDLEAIEEYCRDNLVDFDGRFPEISTFIKGFRAFNMDMLSVLVTEVNLNPELSLIDLSSFLNIKPDARGIDRVITYTLIKNGENISRFVTHKPSHFDLDNFLSTPDGNLRFYLDYEDEDNQEDSLSVLNFDEEESMYTFTSSSSTVTQNFETGVIRVVSQDHPGLEIQITSKTPTMHNKIYL